MRDIISLKEMLTAKEDWLHVASFGFGFVIEQLLCLCTDTVPVLVHYKNTYDTNKQNTYTARVGNVHRYIGFPFPPAPL